MAGRTRLFLSLLAIGGMTGCASLRVGSDYDRDVSFAARQTYDWAGVEEERGEDVERVNPFIDRRLRRAVDFELEQRGYRRVEEGPVDLLVAVSVLDAQEAAQPTRGSAVPIVLGFSFGYAPGFFYPGYGYGYGYGRYGYGRFGRYGYGPFAYRGFGFRPYFGYATGYGAYGPYAFYGGGRTGDLEALAPGTFTVDVLDGESGDLIWRGWANGALAFAPDVEALPEFIASVVHDIMEGFPPEDAR